MAHETQLKFGIVGSDKATKAVDEVNRKYLELDATIAKTGRTISQLKKANVGDGKALDALDHLIDSYHRLKQQAEGAAKAIGGMNYGIETVQGKEHRYKTSSAYLPDKSMSPSGDTPPGRQRSQGFSRNRATGGAMRLLGMAGAALGIGWGVSELLEGLSAAQKYQLALSDVAKQIQLVADAHDKLGQSIENTTRLTGAPLMEIAQLTKAYTTLTGTAEGAQMPILFAKGEGMSLASTAQSFGMLGQMGAVETSDAAMQKFAAIFAQAIQSGHMQGRQEELLRSLVQFSAQQTRILGQASKPQDFLGVLTEMNAGGPAGMRGQYGAQYLDALSEGIRHPGGGGTGLYLMSKALGINDFFKLQFQMEEGIAGGNLPKVMSYLHGLVPGRGVESDLQRAAFMRELFPRTTMHQNLDFMKILAHYKKKGVNLTGFYKWMSKNDITGINPSQFDILARLFTLKPGDKKGLENLLTAPELSGMSKADKDAILQSGSRSKALEILSKQVMMTPSEQLQASLNNIQTDMNAGFTKLLGAVTDLARTVSEGFDWVEQHWPSWLGGGGRKEAQGLTAEQYVEMSKGFNPANTCAVPSAYAPSGETADEIAGLGGIATVESHGSYTVVNKRTGAYGRYQFIPTTWREYARKAGLGANAKMTPANQEAAADVMWRELWGKYYDPRLVAAAWIGGPGVANALLYNRMSSKAFHRHKPGELSIADYIKAATGQDWVLGKSSQEYWSRLHQNPSTAGEGDACSDPGYANKEYLHYLSKHPHSASKNSGKDASPTTAVANVYIGTSLAAQAKSTGNGNAFTPLSPVPNSPASRVFWEATME